MEGAGATCSGAGRARELARLNMPISHYSTFVVTGNLLNWFRFLQLRMEETAQFEIRVYAEAISEGTVQAMERDPSVFVAGIAVDYPSGIFGTTTEPFKKWVEGALSQGWGTIVVTA